MKRALPSLVALRNFEAAARHRSFKRAAAELGVTESAVSHQIGRLEADLGVLLFKRLQSGIALTETGTLYYPFLREAFDQIAHGTALIRPDEATSSLTLQVYVTGAVRWLIPRLHSFRAAHPDIRIGVDGSILDWEFAPRTADIGIIYTEAPGREGIEYNHLFDSQLVAVCSPLFKRGHDGAYTALEAVHAPAEWPAWLAAAGPSFKAPQTVEKFDSYLLAIEAAIAGQGVMVVPEFLVAGDLAASRLVCPVPITVAQPGKWYLTYLKRRRSSRAIQAFRRWLTQQI